VLTTNQKGLVAATAVIGECVRLGIGVCRPLDDERYDLILDLRPRLLRNARGRRDTTTSSSQGWTPIGAARTA
jgi:hypothetical protein